MQGLGGWEPGPSAAAAAARQGSWAGQAAATGQLCARRRASDVELGAACQNAWVGIGLLPIGAR